MFRGRKAHPCSNKYIFNKYIDHCRRLHKQKLAEMKPAVDNTAPVKPSHFKQNKKREHEMEESYTKIERENRILLEKISSILDGKNSPGTDAKNDSSKHLKSLNRSFRKKELQRITKENQLILKRIQDSAPRYDHKQWEYDRKVQEKYLENICQYKYTPHSRLKKRGTHLQQFSKDQDERVGLLIPGQLSQSSLPVEELDE